MVYVESILYSKVVSGITIYQLEHLTFIELMVVKLEEGNDG